VRDDLADQGFLDWVMCSSDFFAVRNEVLERKIRPGQPWTQSAWHLSDFKVGVRIWTVTAREEFDLHVRPYSRPFAHSPRREGGRGTIVSEGPAGNSTDHRRRKQAFYRRLGEAAFHSEVCVGFDGYIAGMCDHSFIFPQIESRKAGMGRCETHRLILFARR